MRFQTHSSGHALIIGGSLQTLGAVLRCVKPVGPGSVNMVTWRPGQLSGEMPRFGHGGVLVWPCSFCYMCPNPQEQ